MAKKYPNFVATKVNDAQLEQVRADAEAYGKSVCGYVRDRITGKRIKAKTDALMLSEIRRIFGLFKHQRINAPAVVAALNALAEKIG